ncbi:4Fe-4S double cluster binding domain-containing protein [Marispirochaeta sp.]|jgi:epoxyqueuosine reductase|uniref:epoxyqueuosine reductase n=1 Tax=Marispirochaeta sp. TaxID=2038653 RepID=UPI0029C837B2|nr:4Fe-4S double cluster binding domain-containing protein [Marispirochaeta sp.]
MAVNSVNAIRKELLRRGFHNPRMAEIESHLVGSGSKACKYLIFMGLYPLPDPAVHTDPGSAVIAPFAAVHYYRRCTKTLQNLVSELRHETGIPKRDIRIFSNSRLPERSIAAALGMGWVGRNGLLMNREYGSSFVLAGMLIVLDPPNETLLQGTGELPRILSLKAPPDPHRECGKCSACVMACPTGAISTTGGVSLERCLQYLSTSTEDLPEFALAAWGRRLYGCQECQNNCPVNINRNHREPPDIPAGEEYPIHELLTRFALHPASALKEIFPGTALEAGWIPRESILRNLLIAAGNSKDSSLEPLIHPFLKDPHPIVTHAASFALYQISVK